MRNLAFISSFVIALTISALAATAAPDQPSVPNGGWDAAWSPDGSMIAFTSGSPHTIPNLWTAKPDGTAMRRLTSRGAHQPMWLPDGKTIVFGTIRNGEPAYASIRADGEADSEKPVDALPPGAQDLLWSPDGSLIAFAAVSPDGKSRDLCYARSEGGAAVPLTGKFWVREWAWSPDGGSIAFVVGRAVGASLWKADIVAKDIKLLYKGFCSAPSYSPDGKRLAIAVPDVRSGFKIVVIDLETGLDKRIGVRTFNGEKIIWSPDGSRLFFSSSPKGKPAVWSVRSRGRDLLRVTPEDLPAQSPSLSPDGTRVAFHAFVKGAYSPELFVCDSASGEHLRRLTHSSPSYWAPNWSPDGARLAFQTDINHASELFVGSASGSGQSRLVNILNPNRAEVSWLRDGDNLLLADGGRLLLVNPRGGKDAAKPVGNLDHPAQAPDISGSEVYFSEWFGRSARISAIGLDGSGKRVLTQKPEEKPASEPAMQEKNDAWRRKTDSGRGPESVLVASAELFVPQAPAAESVKPDPEAGDPHSDLGLMGPQPNVSRQQAAPPVVDMSPAVSPDGALLAFARGGQIWLMSTNGAQQERQLSSFESEEGVTRVVSNPRWSPSGDSLLFLSFNNHSGKLAMEIWLVRVKDAEMHLVYSENVMTEYGVYYADCTYPPAFTPDGKRVLFTSISGGRPHIVWVRVDGSDLQELVAASSSFPALRATGGKLAYVDLASSLERVRILDMNSGRISRPLFKR